VAAVTDLTEMSWSYRTDKGADHHGYTRFYDGAFAELRHRPVTVLEVGVATGGSLMLWAEYFDHPAAHILGIDKNPVRRHFSGRVEVVREDVLTWDPEGREFDIVIDDGSHRYAEVRATFTKLWPLVRPGGLYVVEDVHCMSPHHQVGFIDGLVAEAGHPEHARTFEGDPLPDGKRPGILAMLQKG
jgi:hypothetical protein